ncbi:MAG: nucleotide pyrophosphohydrolase [Candidatus Lokiarchaeota archaeon]|nr:nucleotide pyrophosphohydrolase [Candidatus Lokiarchaeota archaeon]
MNPIPDDNNTSVSFFKKEVQKFVRDRNWTKFHTPKNLVQALSIEVSELSEIFLFKDISLDTIISDKELLENISDEIADVYIYLVSLVNSINLDLTSAFTKKMEKNKTKYSIEEFNNGSYQKL